MKIRLYISCIIILLVLIPPFNYTHAQHKYENKREERLRKTFMIWEGINPIMKVSDLASYCAPIFWFSADEPELRNKKGKDIRIPTSFPFENKSDSPVVYYQVTYILTRDKAKSSAFKKDFSDFGNSVIDLSKVSAVDIYYSHFYRFESGLGSHPYDTEQAQFQFFVRYYTDKDKIKHYVIYFIRVTAKAHALEWYDNIYEIDTKNPDYELSLPFNIFVEEGKHASCSDMNGDGYYTPGYDVNVRKNDAWGVRDVIRSGNLFSSDFKSYMAKIRIKEFRVFPPLPADSPLRKKYSENGIYAPDNAVYQLRPMPSPLKARNPLLKHDMESYYTEFAPYIYKESEENDLLDWFSAEDFIHSLGVSYRLDENLSGISVCFPLLIIKNVEAPLVGGWLVNRIYAQGAEFNVLGYDLLYTPSASRFFDAYASAGLELYKHPTATDSNEHTVKTDFVLETGIKLRGNVTYSPLKFLKFISPFWGVRLGIKNTGFMTIKDLNYIFEIGAGVW